MGGDPEEESDAVVVDINGEIFQTNVAPNHEQGSGPCCPIRRGRR
jgi:hypothetical protein